MEKQLFSASVSPQYDVVSTSAILTIKKKELQDNRRWGRIVIHVFMVAKIFHGNGWVSWFCYNDISFTQEMSQRLTSLKSLSWPYATNGHAINWLDRGGEETNKGLWEWKCESDPWKLGRVSIISEHLRTEDEIKKAN